MDNFFNTYDEAVIDLFYESIVYTDINSDEQWWNESWYKMSYI